jgi:hypothetical protein
MKANSNPSLFKSFMMMEMITLTLTLVIRVEHVVRTFTKGL